MKRARCNRGKYVPHREPARDHSRSGKTRDSKAAETFEALCVPASVLVKEVDGLVKAGLVVERGNDRTGR